MGQGLNRHLQVDLCRVTHGARGGLRKAGAERSVVVLKMVPGITNRLLSLSHSCWCRVDSYICLSDIFANQTGSDQFFHVNPRHPNFSPPNFQTHGSFEPPRRCSPGALEGCDAHSRIEDVGGGDLRSWIHQMSNSYSATATCRSIASWERSHHISP